LVAKARIPSRIAKGVSFLKPGLDCMSTKSCKIVTFKCAHSPDIQRFHFQFRTRRTDSSLLLLAVAATKAAAAAAAGAGRVREVEAMATAMQEQLRALTEAVTRIESVVTASKKSAPEESRREDSTLRKEKERQLRKEMGRKERRIWAAVSETVVQNRESLGLANCGLPLAGF
jgi:hypothetical protein